MSLCAFGLGAVICTALELALLSCYRSCLAMLLAVVNRKPLFSLVSSSGNVSVGLGVRLWRTVAFVVALLAC